MSVGLSTKMVEKKRVLVVDDHQEMLDFLRSVLELSSENCFVLGVSSAAEGIAALKKTSFHLMIVDAELPEKSGLLFVQAARRLAPSVPVMLISGKTGVDNKKRAQELNVYRHYSKPLDSDALITSVYKVLQEQTPADASLPQRARVLNEAQLTGRSKAIQHCLESVRNETGAQLALLATFDGEIISITDSQQDLNLEAVVKEAASSIRFGYRLVEDLGEEEVSAVQYLKGEKRAIYTAVIDGFHWLALLFGVKSGMGKIGTIWFFTQKAIKDISMILADAAAESETIEIRRSESHDEIADAPEAVPAILPPFPSGQIDGAKKDSGSTVGGDQEFRISFDVAAADREPKSELDLFWEKAVEEAALENSDSSGISFEEAQKLGLIPGSDKKPQED